MQLVRQHGVKAINLVPPGAEDSLLQQSVLPQIPIGQDEVASLLGIDDGDDRLLWVYQQEPGPDGIVISVASRPYEPPRRPSGSKNRGL